MYLLDTNHCSAIFNGNPKISKKLEDPSLDIVTCTIVMGELIYMVERSVYREENILKVNDFLTDVAILSADQRSARIYGSLKAKLMDKFGPREKRQRRQYKFAQLGISDNDLWIASIGISNNATIVSDDGDFSRINEVHALAFESWI